MMIIERACRAATAAGIALLCFAATSHAQAPASAEVAPPRIAASVFAEFPSLRAPRLSPDGAHVVGRNFSNGSDGLAVMNLASGKVARIGFPEKTELNFFRWAGNQRILISIASKVAIGSADDIRATQLIVYDLATGQTRIVGRKKQGINGDNLAYVDPAGNWVLLILQTTLNSDHAVYRIDLNTLAVTEVVKSRPDIRFWKTDTSGVVRMGIGYSAGRLRVLYRASADAEFKLIVDGGWDKRVLTLLSALIAPGSDQGYVVSNEARGRYAIHHFDFATLTLGDVLLEDPEHDVDIFSDGPEDPSILGASKTDDYPTHIWRDPQMIAIERDVDRALGARRHYLVSSSRDQQTLLYWVGLGNDPGYYYLYRPASGRLVQLVRKHVQLSPSQIAPTKRITYRARDGLDIHAYLTLPLGRAAKGLPLIILPHGGPFGVRDLISYSDEVQMLANRGYAVLQPNFRGSGGYGQAFYERGDGSLGRAMQDDLDDAMDWAVTQGIVDARRVCLVGASYGGYAALWGATRNPERYRCAASFAGVTNMTQQLRYSARNFGIPQLTRDWRAKIRGPKGFDLDSVSPLAQVARLKVPVLVAHGEEDLTVPFDQAKSYADALKQAGAAFEYHAYPKEGNGFADPKNAADWLERLDAFLARHNPPDSPR